MCYISEAFGPNAFEPQWPRPGLRRPEIMISRTCISSEDHLYLISADIERPVNVSVAQLLQSLPGETCVQDMFDYKEMHVTEGTTPLNDDDDDGDDDGINVIEYKIPETGGDGSDPLFLVHHRRFGRADNVSNAGHLDNSFNYLHPENTARPALTPNVHLIRGTSARISLPKVDLPSFDILHITSVPAAYAPNAPSFVLLGEKGKWVPVSANRIVSIVRSHKSSLSVTVRGSAGESVELLFARVLVARSPAISNMLGTDPDLDPSVNLIAKTCSIGPLGNVTFHVSDDEQSSSVTCLRAT
mmetsp:Transcript_20935/g.29250  ORF Transcript_20935/g.29250 Transcript_20935/m.29250 type:complete len:300 (-) Transcript_20935:59-958(-)